LFVDEFATGVGVAGVAFDAADIVTVVAHEFELDEEAVGDVAGEEETAGDGSVGALVAVFAELFVDEFATGVEEAGAVFEVGVVADEFELEADAGDATGEGFDGAPVAAVLTFALVVVFVALFVAEFVAGAGEAGAVFDAVGVVAIVADGFESDEADVGNPSGEGEIAGVLGVDSVDEDVCVDTGVAVAVGPSAHAETGDSTFITITSVSVRIRQTTLLRFIKT
jgi:hypothetical protein